jgi:hypothetical protein
MMANQIILKALSETLIKERDAGETITPGYLLEVASDGDYDLHSTAGGNVRPIVVALEEDYIGGEISDTYAANDRVRGWYPRSGEEAYMVHNTAEDVSIGDRLISAGDGTVKKYSTESVLTSAVAATLTTGAEASNNAILFTARDAGSAGNTIAIKLTDPSGNDQSESVTVTDGLIDVSLATGAGGAITSTPDTIKSTIEGDAGANELVTVDNTPGTSDGDSAVEAVARTNLSGGADVGEISGGESTLYDSSIVGTAISAVSNASGTTATRIKVEVA